MDLIDKLRTLSSQIPRQMDNIKTEEATKTAFIMPFINTLGYNVFDPSEVCPELIADVGTKKGEKVDYAIYIDGKPMILFECKWCGCNINEAHASQLYRYFSVTEARFGVLTNGIIYRFYTDTEEPNKMDSKPFFEFNMLDLEDASVEELKKFTKALFNINDMLTTAVELKYAKEIKRIMAEELQNPSENFTKLFASQIYSGKKTQAVYQQFTNIVKGALNQFITEQINERLKAAIEQGNKSLISPDEKEVLPQAIKTEAQAVTTEEEFEGYYIVKSILREIVDPKRIAMRDVKSWCGVLLDDNDRKPICRLYFNTSNKYIGIFDKDRKEVKFKIESPDDIFTYTDLLKEAIKGYEDMKNANKLPKKNEDAELLKIT